MLRIIVNLIVLAAIAQEARAADEKRVVERDPRGTWKVVSAQIGQPLGREVHIGERKGFYCVIADGRISLKSEKTDEELTSGTIKLHPDLAPQGFDMTLELTEYSADGAAKQILETRRGVFERKGDRLKIYFAHPRDSKPTARPTSFPAKPDAHRELWILELRK